MTILDYNRVLRDLNGRSPEQLLADLRQRFAIQRSDQPVRPDARGEFGMYLDGLWYKLTIRPDLVPDDDLVGRLPITLLARNVIEPLFGITDPRTDGRIDFVGGGRGLAEFALEARIRLRQFGGNFGIVPFFDGGSLSTDVTPSFSDWRFGAGLGLRYYSSFGPIRIDVGFPLNRQQGDGPVAVTVSLGQAF